MLSCFLVNNTLKLSDAVGYNGADPLFTQDIWKSPRLLIVPKIQTRPERHQVDADHRLRPGVHHRPAHRRVEADPAR